MRTMLTFGLLFLIVPAHGETPPPPPAPLPSGLSEEVQVELVQFNILATDRKGNPVSDLKPEELVLLDHGKKQRVSYLQRVLAPEKPAPPLPLDQRPLAAASTGSGPWVVPEAALPPGRRLILFFDNYLSSQRTKIKSVQAARSLVLEKLSPNDQVAVVSFDGKLEILQDFTRDTSQILAGLEKTSARWDRAAPDFYEGLDELVEFMERCDRAMAPVQCAMKRADAYVDQRRRDAEGIMEALNQLIRAVAPIQDIKSLLLFSDGFSRNPEREAALVAQMTITNEPGHSVVGIKPGGLETSFRELISSAAQARVTIFSVYPGGQNKTSAISARRRDPVSATKGRFEGDLYRRAEANNQQGVEELAYGTGGEPLRSAEIDKSLDRVLDLTAGLYTAAFKPVGVVGERTHSLKVSCTRKGVEITTRREIPHRGFGPRLRGTLAVEGAACDSTQRRQATLKLTLDRSSLVFREIGQERQANLTLGSRILSTTGEVLFDQLFTWNIPEVEPGAEGGSTGDPAFKQEMIVPCRPLVVDIQVVDIGSERRGGFSGALAP